MLQNTIFGILILAALGTGLAKYLDTPIIQISALSGECVAIIDRGEPQACPDALPDRYLAEAVR